MAARKCTFFLAPNSGKVLKERERYQCAVLKSGGIVQAVQYWHNFW